MEKFILYMKEQHISDNTYNSYANDIKVTKDEAKFLTANKLEASPGDVITLTVNLSNINYENFEFFSSLQEKCFNMFISLSDGSCFCIIDF